MAGLGVAVHEWRTTDLVPHLAGDEDQNGANDDQRPRGLVEQKLEVVALQVEQAADHEDHGDGQQEARVVRWAENFDLNQCNFIILDLRL